MDDFELEIKKEFLNEALMNLEEVESSFMELESASDPKPLLDKIFRLAHNLKGGSRAVGFGEVAEFTHQLESLVLKIQKGEIQLSPDLITVLLQSNDRLVEMLSELKGNLAAVFDNTDVLVKIQSWLSGTATISQSNVEKQEQAPQAEVETAITDVSFDPLLASIPSADAFFSEPSKVDVPAPVLSINDETTVESKSYELIELPNAPREKVMDSQSAIVADEKPTRNSKSQDSGVKEDEIIRVSLAKIDLLNDSVGELIVLQSVVHQQIISGDSVKLSVSVRQLMKLSKDIQNLSMSLRMLPVKPMVQKLQRVVRDTARALTKEVQLQVIGEQMDIDKSVLDRLSDPLIHILRNAVDHGLETPEGRSQSGKTPEGKVTLSFMNEGNHLLIEIQDDGKGINSEVLRKKAVEKGLISEGQSMTEKQLIHLIFHPGFSTKTETSEISGRGVGMDVVKTNIEAIGGQVEISTTLGRGSIFRLQIPLTLAVVEGLVVTSEKNRYVVPLSQVQETVNLKAQKVFDSKLGIGSCFELRGTVVPIISLDEALEERDAKPNNQGTALIVNVRDQLIALVVHDILRAQQIVIKPLSNGIVPQKGWVGTCVLGDGLPTLILSPVELLTGKITQSFIEGTIGVAA